MDKGQNSQIEKAREYLRGIKAIGMTRGFLEDRIKFYENLCEKCTSVLSDMPKGGSQSIEELYAKLIDLKTEWVEGFKRDESKRVEASVLIESMENERHKALLHYHYIERWTLRKAANEIGVSYQWAKELHSEALEAFGIVLEEK